MCRNIRTLFNLEPPVNQDEIRAASLQYVRKVSGYNSPSIANAAAFEMAIDDIAAATARLLESLETRTGPRDRESLAARRRSRYESR